MCSSRYASNWRKMYLLFFLTIFSCLLFDRAWAADQVSPLSEADYIEKINGFNGPDGRTIRESLTREIKETGLSPNLKKAIIYGIKRDDEQIHWQSALLASEAPQEFLPELMEVVRKESWSWSRMAVFDRLVKIKSPEILAFLKDMLRTEKHSDHRIPVYQEIAMYPDSAPFLMDQYTSPTRPVGIPEKINGVVITDSTISTLEDDRRIVIGALGRIPEMRVAEFIAKMAQESKDEKILSAAIRALGHLAGYSIPDSDEMAGRIYLGDGVFIAYAPVDKGREIDRATGADLEDLALSYSNHESPSVRRSVIRAASFMATAKSMAVLERMSLTDADKDIRQFAQERYGTLKKPIITIK
jgi:hypothetical protein